MKISEAEKLWCPFIIHGLGTNTCIADKCMAWKMIKTIEIQDNFFKCTCGQTFDVYRYDFICPKCGVKFNDGYVKTDLPREDCEGYCKRLNIKE